MKIIKVSSFVLILVLATLISFAQSKHFISKIDTTYNTENKYLKEYNSESFFASGISDETMDVANIDHELLNATIFFTLNKFRARKKREMYKYSFELENIAFNYVLIKSKKRIEDNRNNWQRIYKDFPGIGNLFDFKGKLITFNIACIDAIDYKKGKKFYYDRKDKSTDLKLYYGERHLRGEVSKEKIPIRSYSYMEFADELISNFRIGHGSRNAKSKAYEYVGCYVDVDERTLHRRKIPKIKAMIVYGGFRLKGIK